LERFDGTVVFVSHDRYFLDRIADGIVVVSDGEAVRHTGGYSKRASTSPALVSTPLRPL
jgi:ATPase subunit of ABC transporter with duplicated ATPase domains